MIGTPTIRERFTLIQFGMEAQKGPAIRLQCLIIRSLMSFRVNLQGGYIRGSVKGTFQGFVILEPPGSCWGPLRLGCDSPVSRGIGAAR